MKHIFYIHSHITHIVARSVVLEANISPESLFFIFGRNFFIDNFPYPYFSLSENLMALTQIPSYGEQFLIRKIRILRKIDRMLAQVADGEKFVAYLPSTKNYLMQFIITHSLCDEFNIIEEGLSTYAGTNVKRTNSYYQNNLIGRAKAYLKYPAHLGRSTVHYSKQFSRVYRLYTISEDLKHFLPNESVHVLSEWYIPEIPEFYHLTNESVFFFDATVEHNTLDYKEFERAFQLFVAYWASTGRRLWLKFHPANTMIQDTVYSILRQHSITFVEIPPLISPESLLLNSHMLKVFGFYSSVLYYAAKFGHSAFSLDSFIESKETKSLIGSTTPSDFFDVVTKLRL